MIRLRARRYCKCPGCESKELVGAKVTITEPPAAAQANQAIYACGGCALRAVQAFIGFGWGVHVELVEQP